MAIDQPKKTSDSHWLDLICLADWTKGTKDGFCLVFLCFFQQSTFRWLMAECRTFEHVRMGPLVASLHSGRVSWIIFLRPRHLRPVHGSVLPFMRGHRLDIGVQETNRRKDDELVKHDGCHCGWCCVHSPSIRLTNPQKESDCLSECGEGMRWTNAMHPS